MKVQGKAFKYGNDIDTDAIIPARHLNTTAPEELAMHCMEDTDKNFINEVKNGDIIVALKNFGCGSSREHAPIALKAAGISCVIAKSYARIFYRNSFNIGLPILECESAADRLDAGGEISVDFETGVISNITKREEYKAEPFPEFIQQIIKCDGLVEYAKNKLGGSNSGL